MLRFIRWSLVAVLASGLAAPALTAVPNFTTGADPAVKFGVHEVVLAGGAAGEGELNPFDLDVTVRFTPPAGGGRAKTVTAFFDGDGTWRARVYVDEPGEWRWVSRCSDRAALDGRAGVFRAGDSRLRGRLLVHPGNPRQWMTEDGRWFLNLNDTAYCLLGAYAADGSVVSEGDFRAYVRDAVEHGITSFRSFPFIGPGGYLEDSRGPRSRWRDGIFADDARAGLQLPHFRVADERLRWLLDEFPEVYLQFVLFPRGAPYAQDDRMWVTFTAEQKARIMRYVIARYAAFPQLFWLVTNDAHYGAKHPNNNTFAREVGEFFLRHDPWRHPMSAGHARRIPYVFGDEPWSTYIHLEDNFAVGAQPYERYHGHAKPVFLGEDRYEQDHPLDRDPRDMRYFQRRLFWAWLLSGGSTNYGGRWWAVHPYRQTGTRPAAKPVTGGGEAASRSFVHTAALTGLDSVAAIRNYFATRRIELSEFEPAHTLARDPEGATGQGAPRLMRCGQREFLIYLPNATSDDREMKSNPARAPQVSVDLGGAEGTFRVEWFRALDGVAQDGGTVNGGGMRVLRSPWRGEDCVVRIWR